MMNDRAEIACHFRWLSRHDDVLYLEPVHPGLGTSTTSDNVLWNIMDVTGCFKDRNYCYMEQMVRKLADLIDPTCHNKAVVVNKMAPLELRTDNLICSNCGETFCADPDGINAPIDWAYCPNCGCRIINEEL